MSMLAELLSKVQQPKLKREVAPNLKNIVTAPAGLSAHKKKIIVLSTIFIVSAMSGVFFIQYLNSLSGPDIVASSVSPDAVKQKVRERQAVTNKPSNPLHSDTPSDAQKTPEDTQPVMSVKDPVVVIAEKGPVPDNITSDVGNKVDTPITPEKSVNKIVADNPSSPALKAESPDIHGMDAYLYKAREYETKGDYSKALVNYKKALEMDKGNYAVINNIAYIYLRLNLTDESIRYSSMAIDINRDYSPALINLGIACAKSGDLAKAQERLEHAFVLEPDNKNVVLNLAVLHERQGRSEEAGEYFSRLVKSGDVDGALGLARVYEKQGKIEGAIKLYRSVHDQQSADDRMKSHARKRIIELNNRK